MAFASYNCPRCQSDRVIKKGYFKTKYNHQPVRRYECKSCKKCFSSHTFKSTYRQKRPALNEQVYKWYVSSVTQRRMAIILGCDRKTIVRKFLFMAMQARKEHERRIKEGEIKTSFVQFDEMETFEHTRLKPLSIAIAVRGKTGEIIEARVASMNCHGSTAALSQKKYGYREDHRDAAREDVLKVVNTCSREKITIVTDQHNAYPAIIKKWVPDAEIIRVKSIHRRDRSKNVDRRNRDTSQYTFNYIAAKIRHDLSRMARRSWVTTKRVWALQAHLDLYIAWNNGYKIT